jgi:hypothetical protein
MDYRNQLKLFLIYLLIGGSIQMIAQTEVYRIDRSYNGLPLLDFISKAEQKLPLHFYYQKDSLPTVNILVKEDTAWLVQVLNYNLNPSHVFVTLDSEGNVFLTKDMQIKEKLPHTFFTSQLPSRWSADSAAVIPNYLKTKNEMGIKTIYVGNRRKGAYKEEAVMSGYLTGGSKGTKVLGATLYFEELKSGAVTDADGFYSMQLKKRKIYTGDQDFGI